MTEYKVKYNEVFDLTKHAFESGIDMIGHKGGTGSGKTYDLMIFCLLYLTQNIPPKEKNPVITILSESMPHLKRGAMRYGKMIMQDANLTHLVNYNKTDNYYEFEKCVVEFISADRLGAAIGNRRYALYANEINNINYEIYDEMARRSTLNMFDFNPTYQFWLEDKLLPFYPRNEIIKSNHESNKDLPLHEKERILLRAKKDPNFKRIHIDCEYGVSEGLVFENWNMIDLMPESFEMERFGMDFGYTNDPTTLIHMRKQGEKLFFDELFYQTGLLNTDIIALMNNNGLKKNFDVIHADSAEPKSIEEIYRAGYNCKPATIAKKSINNRIDKLKTYDIYVTKRSTNLIKELRSYFWISDKQGNPTNKPIDNFNHAIDAMGYAINDLLIAKQVIGIGIGY